MPLHPRKVSPHDNLDHALGRRSRVHRHIRCLGRRHQPRHGPCLRRVALASREDAQRVIASATSASRGWGKTSLARRTQVMFAFRELLNTQGERP
ncbi:MAG: aldehyde dehydrogenase family protein [Aeromicrobium sp.]